MRRSRLSVLTGLLAAAVAPPAAAAPAGFSQGDYDLQLRSEAVSVERDDPGAPVRPAAAHTAVALGKAAGSEVGECRTAGSVAYDDGVVVDDAPKREGSPRLGTVARDRWPSPHPGAPLHRPYHDRAAADFLHAPGADAPSFWGAWCDNDAAGRATANSVEAEFARAAATATTGAVNRNTGVYTGTATAHLGELQMRTRTLEAIASEVRVRYAPGAQPRFSYRITIADRTLVSGADVEARNLVQQFRRAARDHAATLAALGLTLVAPTVTRTGDGGHVVIAPALEFTVDGVRVRLLGIAFAGRNG